MKNGEGPLWKIYCFSCLGKVNGSPQIYPTWKVVTAGTQRTAGCSPDFSLENNSREQLYLGILNFCKHKMQMWGSYPELPLHLRSGWGETHPLNYKGSSCTTLGEPVE